MAEYSIVLHGGEHTLSTSRIVTEQQGSWQWQIRLARATYVAVYSPRVKAWLWKSQGRGPSFSGGNWRNVTHRITPDGSLHNIRLDSHALAALALVRGEA